MPTHIGWTNETWNVISGCTRISEGCDHCYIERTPPFRMAHRRFDHDGVGGTTGVMLHPERLGQPLKWRKPRRIFVCSLADLFHDDVPDSYIARVWSVMAAAPQHTFQVLSKRHARMRSLVGSAAFREAVGLQYVWGDDIPGDAAAKLTWPLPNVWLGVSAENQQWADIRIPTLLRTPAAVRWVSAEPLLGPLDLTATGLLAPDEFERSLSWLVVGGESGPGARPMPVEWARQLQQQCADAGVPFFMKQLGTVTARELGLKGAGSDVVVLEGLGFLQEYPVGNLGKPGIDMSRS